MKPVNPATGTAAVAKFESKSTTAAAPAGSARGKSKKGSKDEPLPITLTITGELAGLIRYVAKRLGERPATTARRAASFGQLITSPDEEGEEYRVQMAARTLGFSEESAWHLHKKALEEEARWVAERRARVAAVA